MYGIALSVAACLRGGTRVDVAWNLDPGVNPRFDSADAVAITPGGGRLGSLLDGAVDSRLVEVASAGPTNGRVIEIELDAIESHTAGVEPGTALRILMAPAHTLPSELWEQLVERRRIRLVAELDGDTVVATEIVPTDASGSSVDFESGSVTTTWSPRSTLVVMGPGPMAAALVAAGELVGWNVEHCPGAEAAVGRAATLAGIDGIVVVGHDIEGTGRVLQAAVNSRAGYIGSVGPQSVQAARLDWLAYRGISDADHISAPAGIDIGARTPGEVAISVIAQMISVQKRATHDQPHS